MKIVKKGRDWFKRITCKGCETLLEIEEPDIQYKVTEMDVEAQQYEDDINGTFFVNCGNCELVLPIKVKDIPNPVIERIKGN
jgi:transcription elongation factor Elf1